VIHRPKKVPTPQQRAKDGQWQVRWRYKLAGQWHRPARLFATEAEANDFILKELVGESNRDPKAARLSFDTYADKYLAEVGSSVKPTTLKRERGALGHARAFFAGMPVSDIKPSDCRAFRVKLTEGGCTSARRKITRTASVNHAFRVLRAVLDLAVEDAALPSNPAVLRRMPGRNTNREAKFRAVFLNADQVEALASALERDGRGPYDLMVRFLAYTGLRTGELAGLDVTDVKLWQAKGTWRGYVDVHRTRRKAKGGWVEDTPKSEESTRRVTLPPWLAGDVAAYLAGTHPRADEPDAPLFPGRKVGGHTHGQRTNAEALDSGRALNWQEPIEPGAFYRNVFKKALAQAGLPMAMRLHDLRHTFAALWLAAGGEVYALSEQMGHASFQTTHKFYAHLIAPDEDAPHVFAARPAGRPSGDSNVVPLRPTGTQ
jgi:integrase